MFSKILVKLIDQSIIPAVLLLTARILSVVFVSKYLNIPFQVGASGFEYSSQQDYVLVNSYSVFAMVVILALGLFFVLLKSFVFHDSHISPGLTVRLFSLNLSSFIQDSFSIYSQGAIWVSYVYLLMFVSGIMTLFELLYAWVFFVALGAAVISTVLLILDVENELWLKKESGEDSSGEDYVLNFGDDYEQ